MSIEAIRHVWKHSESTGGTRLMMVAIADTVNEVGDGYPGVSRLAEKCKYSIRRAQQLINELELLGELQVFENAGHRTKSGWTNLYRVVIPEITQDEVRDQNGAVIKPRQPKPVEKKIFPKEVQPVTPLDNEPDEEVKPVAPDGVKPVAPDGVKPVAPRTYLEPSGERKNSVSNETVPAEISPAFLTTQEPTPDPFEEFVETLDMDAEAEPVTDQIPPDDAPVTPADPSPAAPTFDYNAWRYDRRLCQLAVSQVCGAKFPVTGDKPPVWSHSNLMVNFFTGQVKPSKKPKEKEWFDYQFEGMEWDALDILAYRLMWNAEHSDDDGHVTTTFPATPAALERHAHAYMGSAKRNAYRNKAGHRLCELITDMRLDIEIPPFIAAPATPVNSEPHYVYGIEVKHYTDEERAAILAATSQEERDRQGEQMAALIRNLAKSMEG